MPHIIPGQHIHLVGIGGAGLSAIARILIGQGYKVSGSDRTLNALTDALARDGAAIYSGHDAANIAGADALIVSSAIKPDQVEIAAALANGIPVYKRADIMADLMVGKKVIAVAGTAGKTTTTAMITHILVETGRDPSYIIGGVLATTGQNAAVGKGDAFVVEADEYDNMFLGLRPNVAVVTNVEWDHPDFFKTPEDMQRSFEQFVSLLPKEGTLVAGLDGQGGYRLSQFATRLNRFYTLWYSLADAQNTPRMVYNLIVAGDLHADALGTSLNTWATIAQEHRVPVRLQLAGKHNVQNATAAICAALAVGIEWREAAEALATFKGTARRFELKGEIAGIAVIDDYAHHPAKIRATLEAARSRYPDRQIWAVWQPHTYSRTQALRDDFITAFKDADHVLITDIYAAREQPIPGVNAADLAAQIENAQYTPTFEDAVAALEVQVKAPAAVIVMSAGDATQISAEYLRRKSNQWPSQ
ncbi:MAG TPA: UDP-N-acetylmuramate--L-alanine ligase [Phototrophicaceae bacterium]|nr:UDP-N-acetylmuramate--L-alanine ligase [Phototrophicaceae bacterium]